MSLSEVAWSGIRRPRGLIGWVPLASVVASYVIFPGLLAWFAVVAFDAAQELEPREIAMPTVSSYDPYLDDFAVFYSAGRMVREGEGSDIYDVPAVRAAQEETIGAGEDELLVLPFFNPPFAVLPLAGLSILSPTAAAIAWTLVGLAVGAVCSIALARSRLRRPDHFAVLICGSGIVASVPFFQVLVHGQTTFFLIAGWTLAWFGIFAGDRRWMGVAGLVLIAHKPPLLLPLLVYLVFTRKWRLLIETSMVIAALTAMVVATTSWRLVPDYIQLLANAVTWDETNGISTWGMFGWNAFSRGLVGDSGPVANALTLALDAATVVVVLTSMRRSSAEKSLEGQFAVLVFASLLLTPHLYAHDVLLAALPIFLLATSRAGVERDLWTGYALAGWFLLYFHFDVLSATGVNVVALWLALGLVLVGREEVVLHWGRKLVPSRGPAAILKAEARIG